MTRLLLAALAVTLLSACATWTPWLGIEQWDANTRAALPRWQDSGRLWIGIKRRIADKTVDATFICRDGIPVGVVVVIPTPGRAVITWPADVCRSTTPAPKARPSV